MLPQKPRGSDAVTGFVQSTINLVETAASTEPAEPDDSDTQHQQNQQGQAVAVQHRDTFEEDERVGHRTDNCATHIFFHNFERATLGHGAIYTITVPIADVVIISGTRGEYFWSQDNLVILGHLYQISDIRSREHRDQDGQTVAGGRDCITRDTTVPDLSQLQLRIRNRGRGG